MIPLSLLPFLFQSMFAITSRTTSPTNLPSLLDTISNTPDTFMNEIHFTSIPEGTYIGNNIEIKNKCLELSGEQSNKRASLGAHIVPQSGFDSNRNDESFSMHSGENCIFSLANSTLSLESLHFALVANSEESRQQRNKARPARLAIVSDSMLTISESAVKVSSGTSAILISPSTFEESTTSSSVVVKMCSISSENDQLRGIVETPAFPDLGASRSVSIVGCSFNSQEVLGTDGIVLSLTQAPRKNVEDVGTISSSLIGCSFVNMSSIGSSHPPQLSHLNQKMLECVVSLTSSHLSGSTIRDVNNGGSLLCSNSSFSSLLSSHTTDQLPTITHPNGTSTPFVDDGTEYYFDQDSGDEFSIANFSHCHFTGANYASDARALTFEYYPGSISIVSCSFANHHFTDIFVEMTAAAVFIIHHHFEVCPPLTLRDSNFTNLSAVRSPAVNIDVSVMATIVDCTLEECAPEARHSEVIGGLDLYNFDPSSHTTITNVIFESCHAHSCGGMDVAVYGTIHLSDCRFEACSVKGHYTDTSGLSLSLAGETPTHVTRLTFTDCWSSNDAFGMNLHAKCDVLIRVFQTYPYFCRSRSHYPIL
ncbi:hypothetical protein BLNAU_17037 [Blattamonas nauphoetae]|uniref:Right handed beta helix domain-containing protein n=1 Tax=Blattamonas nauphoetae TaxID=2049346 RepID=A0ABQ9X7S3_9EUKA|nr:hypothetical protein BLNAU_17037 [Blattamonas nauphoetae]